MDSEVKKLHRSLPPLVEGKVHGTLTLVIDEVVWTRKSPGDVTVVASWWGEHDSAQFSVKKSVSYTGPYTARLKLSYSFSTRPKNSIADTDRTNEDTTEIYAVKTNATLFEDYIKNCETIELVFVLEKTHEVIGTAHIGELLEIFACKSYSRYVSILSNSGDRIGEVHVSLQLMYLATKLSNMQLKMRKFNKKREDDDILLSAVDRLQYNGEAAMTSYKDAKENIKKEISVKSVKIDTFDTYRSILKDKRPEFQESRKKLGEMVTDKLVAQIVARAQRLRGAILKETYNEDSLALSDSSMSNGIYASAENEARLYEYILGKKMTSSEEKQALNTLRSTSPTPSLIDLASKTITTCKYDDTGTRINENSPVKSNNPADALCKETTYTEPKETTPLDYVDSIRIFIESFTLSPAGYRRAKSTCLQHGVPLSLTYFVQYNTFGSARQTNVKSNNDSKFMRTCAKKQVGQVIDFNSESIYGISRHVINRNSPLKFKIFVRHLNQKLPTELGYGSMNISEIVNTINLSNTQRIIIINKGIKIGELKVTIELGCDFIHFGKEFVDAVVSAKENIPILEMNSLTNTNGNKYRSVTGTHSSKSSSKVSSVSAKRIECLTSDSNKDVITAKDITQHQQQSLDNKKVDISNPETDNKDKVLLHGLIYVAEGKDLPESNTYLICRAFWREDKATSQICSNTKNPFYHFCQLIPLIHGTELLERIRDNYIIIEVYSRQNCGTDNLLGIAKLPVHQLYVAYRDPLVLPHLLLSKYPIISVDGWVNINDPVSGKSCGELLALVALGTAEQIALLEVSRGLRNTTIMSQIAGDYHHCIPDNTNCGISVQKNLQHNIPEMSDSSGQSTYDNNFAYHVYNMSDRDVILANNKTQEVQTDISVLKDGRMLEVPFTEDIILHGLVDSSANACALRTSKASTDQSAQTEMKQMVEAKIDREELCLNTLNNNGLSDDNDSYSLRNNFQLPTEMYRSVGVGAEYDEQLDQQQNNVYNNLSNSSVTEENVEKDEPTNYDNSFFRAVVEIECALHLPKIERLNESVEPSTYVTFQDLTLKSDSNGQLNSYMITNIFPHSCDPKWNWRCDAKLPTELLLNNEKRLIFKVWYLNDPDITTVMNLEKDAVIGFSAVDLSVLMAGLPTVSGWFHIMDFTGKCNGQIKISITPLDNLPPFEKCVSTGANNLSECNNLPHTNWPLLYNATYSNVESNNAQQTYVDRKEQDTHVQDGNDKQDETHTVYVPVDAGQNLEGVSMSILSLSLKQKLSELNEITKRLQSRLRDVTNTAFEDEFDSDFEVNESNSEHEYVENRNAEIAVPILTVHSSDETLEIPKQQCKTQNDQNNTEGQIFSAISSDCNPQSEPAPKQSRTTNPETNNDAGYCSSSNTHFSLPRHYQYPCTSIHNYSWDSSAEYPARGTKMHINHLLDKLSLDLPPKPPAEADIPMRRNIIDLFAKLREHRNNSQDKNKSNHGVDTCSVPTQTDNINEHSYTINRVTPATSDTSIGGSVPRLSEESQSRNKISTVIREELVAEENDDVVELDDLTTYLITTNIRYRNVDGLVNPLLYQHLVPDLQTTFTVSPEGEAVEQLDSRYARNFSTAMNSDRTDRNSAENDLSQVDTRAKSRTNVLESAESAELLRLTPSGVSGNVSGNIDVTVIHKSSNSDLTSGNSTESTVTTSFEKLSIQQADIETENYCFTVSELSVPGVSRQAPDGGNPVEEVKISVVAKQQDDDVAQDVSTAS